MIACVVYCHSFFLLKNIGKYFALLLCALLFLQHFKRVCSETNQLWTFCKLSLAMM